jgi:hypothetical protein
VKPERRSKSAPAGIDADIGLFLSSQMGRRIGEDDFQPGPDSPRHKVPASFNARKASTFGIEATTFVDGRAVMARVRGARRVRRCHPEKSKDTRRHLHPAIGTFFARDFIRARRGRKVSAKAIVIATGSRPSVPRPFDKLGDIVITNETVFELTSHVRLLHVGTSQFTRQTAGGNFCLQIGGDRPQGES